MRIATKTRYAVRFMIDLAEHESEGRIPLKDVAQRQRISKKYLEQVVSPLVDAKLITVTRGAAGGYSIARAAEDITMADIVCATEGDLNLLDCLGSEFACPFQERCSAKSIWSGLEDAFATYLRGISLKEIADLKLIA